MKRMLLLLLVMQIVLAGTCLAEKVLVDPYAGAPAEAALSEELAARLTAATGEEYAVRHEADTASAVNAFLQLDGGSALLVCNQEALILSLQGYTNQDLRTALQPVTCVAASESMIYAAPAVTELIPEKSAEALIAYTEENPYEVVIARLIDASPFDYLVLKATEDMYVDEELYMDFDEASQAAQDGAAEILVLSEAMKPEGTDVYEPFCLTGLPGIWQGVFLQAGADSAWLEQLNDTLGGLKNDEAWQQMIAAAGYSSAPCPAPEEFASEVKSLFEQYVQYLTNEGLFFYEE